MDITVVARNAEIHPNFRAYVEEKVSKITQSTRARSAWTSS